MFTEEELVQVLGERQVRLLYNAVQYAEDPNGQGGLPGHNLMMLINHLRNIMGLSTYTITRALEPEEKPFATSFSMSLSRYENKCIGAENGCACDLCYNPGTTATPLKWEWDDREVDELPLERDCCEEQGEILKAGQHLDDNPVAPEDKEWFAEVDGDVLTSECGCGFCQYLRNKETVEKELSEFETVLKECNAAIKRALETLGQ